MPGTSSHGNASEGSRQEPPPAPSKRLLLAVALAVVALQSSLHWPNLDRPSMWPDAMEYLLIANSWANGSGFVDPVQWFYMPDVGQVLPAFWVRAPLVPFFFGVAFWFGSTMLTALQLYTLWCAVVVGIVVLGAARMMRLPTAAAAALWIGASTPWAILSRMPMTETTAVAMVIPVLLTIRFARRSMGGAALCAALTLVGWLARPNLAGMALAVFVAICLSARPRPTLRHGPAWTYLLVFTVGFLLIRGVTVAVTGAAPYSGYGTLALYLHPLESSFYAAVPPDGFLALLAEQSGPVADAAWLNATRLFRSLFFSWVFLWIGWLGAAGVLWCLWGGLHHRLERRFTAFCALGFGLGVVLTLGYWDAYRYPLLCAAMAALCGAALLDDLCLLAQRRWNLRRVGAVLGFVPLVAALTIVAKLAPPPAQVLANAGWMFRDVQGVTLKGTPRGAALKALCREIPPNAFVASRLAWTVSVWCGNPTIVVPRDFHKPRQRARFVAERRPAYFVEAKRKPVPRRGPGFALVPVASNDHYTLLQTVGVESEELWHAPPPLGCAGHSSACREGGRSLPFRDLSPNGRRMPGE